MGIITLIQSIFNRKHQTSTVLVVERGLVTWGAQALVQQGTSLATVMLAAMAGSALAAGIGTSSKAGIVSSNSR